MADNNIGSDFFIEEDMDLIYEEVLSSELQMESQTVRGEDVDYSTTDSENIVQIKELMISTLKEIQPSFNFHQFAQDLENDPNKITDVAKLLASKLSSCISTKSKVTGVNREASQGAFFKIVHDLKEVTAVTENHQLTVWLALQVFQKLLVARFSDGNTDGSLVGPITSEESDIAHYIGGCVVSKLRKRMRSSESEVLGHLVSEEDPESETLLAAKTRGKLTNINNETKKLFVELEQVFRDCFPMATINFDDHKYRTACYKNSTIQSCFFSATYEAENTDSKEKVLSSVIQFYFKIRVHHKCKTIIDGVRAKNKVSSKEKALRTKLAK